MRIAAFQRHAIFDNLDQVCDVLEHDLRWAGDEGIQIALFPETFLLGHSYDPLIIAARAERLVNGGLETLCSRLAFADPTVIVGAFERQGEVVTNSAFVIEGGRVMGRYAKACPNEPGVVAGADYPVFWHSGLCYGINICNDANRPAIAQRLADQGANLILYPLNNMLPSETATQWRTRSIETLQARARQTRCWVASADVTGRQGKLMNYGCTAIIRPDGEIVSRAREECEDVVVFTLPPITTNLYKS
ncbi:putative N-carbamoyl-D-amino acid hydrolase [Nitrospira sp. KM1]|uniref:carbon-nitrogen hydrolase family protein n=1 Tax=Nitrospira sp. KM1 TaxID=1936990 RepID=UPI0013A75D44|nr:carbon-nitrogen hydrolase family protein [Nitrospira sp. KM1]BCA53244.1 putative N-carbamoyl-D-amino acid hydrolase [Nitrospira sp. KM1]